MSSRSTDCASVQGQGESEVWVRELAAELDVVDLPHSHDGKASSDVTRTSTFSRGASFIWRQITFLGPGLVASCAYTDPGNWATDLAAGAGYGYAHLFVILAAILSAMWFQVLAARLGIVSGKDLAEQCRAHWHTRTSRPRLFRWLVFYPLYAMSELSMIFTDMGELIGSAIAINLLSNGAIPLYAGVLITCADVVLVLLLFYAYPPTTASRTVRGFELMMATFVLVTVALLAVLVAQVRPQWGHAFLDFLPNAEFVPNGGLYAAAGIIGATLAPNAIYLGSKVSTVQRATIEERVERKEQEQEDPEDEKDLEKSITPMQELPLLVKLHLRHATVDIAFSLVVAAIVINSLILILAAASATSDPSNAALLSGSLFAFFDLINNHLGKAPAVLYALAVLASGLAAGLVVTLGGQIVSEGFLHWTVKPWVRRVATRCISMIPALTVAIAVGSSGITELLLIAQVANSLTLPFIICPLLLFTSDPKVMTVRTPFANQDDEPKQRAIWRRILRFLRKPLRKPITEDGHNFSTSVIMDVVGWLMIVVLCICNLYGLVQVSQGSD